ncbi:ABC transporter ATP-binding protein [Acidimangrovimonas sediminis]|uniref:ABC transporter ATP-binding protein n=1 Tax=Acidimangrovimonas sediminis TaxID=2056283 RepID=UPI000C80B73A|nr:ABC transporter ATP-binding protein [Acidimangrovimonas sediminis]
MTAKPLLEVRDLRVGFRTGGAETPILHGLDFAVNPGEIFAIVGESGSGKSVTAMSLMGLLPRASARIDAGRALFEGEDLLHLPPERLRAIRGSRIGMIFQEPMTSLNPVLSIGRQMTEAPVAHGRASRRDAARLAVEMLERVGIPEPARRPRQFPHEFSGGMRQRVMIAMAMMMRPSLLIADEPTTALDVTVQAQILGLMRDLVRETGTSMILITHDMGVVAEMADRVMVMRHGRIVEAADTASLFARPTQPYTRDLLAAVPRIDGDTPAPGPARKTAPPVLRLDTITKSFGGARPALAAVSLQIAPGEILGLVGESGSGKSTLGRAAARLTEVDGGTVTLEGRDITRLRGSRLREVRAGVQMIFQDPYSSLDPRLRIGRTIAEPLAIHAGLRGRLARARTGELLAQVGLDPEMADRFPHEFSGGQRQRIAIARALAAKPRLIIADEPTSALDVSVQAQVLDLLGRLSVERELAFLFISHDLSVVRKMARRVAVMRAGRLLEIGPTAEVLGDPRHAYTRALIAAAPIPDPAQRDRLTRAAPPGEYPDGPLRQVGQDHWVAA